MDELKQVDLVEFFHKVNDDCEHEKEHKVKRVKQEFTETEKE